LSRTRVAYLLKRFPRLSETFVLNEILEVRRRGLDVIVYALEDPLEGMVQPAAERLRAEVVYLHGSGRGLKSWSRLLSGAALEAATRPRGALRVFWALLATHRSLPSMRHAVEALWLCRDLRRRGAGHLHAHFAHSPAAVAYLVHLASRFPFSFTAHAKDLYTTLPRNIKIRARAADFVITCTDFNRRHLEGLLADGPPATIHVLYHGTDLARFDPAERRAAPGHVLSVGRLVPKKGYDRLIDALSRLDEDGVALTCDIFGGGQLKEDLAARIGAAGLGGKVRLHGARLQDDVIAAYRTASVFALSPVVLEDGDRDGIPNVLVEAMASGVPVVATRISGIPELIEHEVEGLLVDPDDVEGLANAIRRLLEDPLFASRLARAGREKVERSFDLSANSRSLVELFTGEAVALPAAGEAVA
jgi:glycosyltransferase involved in cell wall biosynthesis